MYKVVGHLQKMPLAQLPSPYRLGWDGRTGEGEAELWGWQGQPWQGGHHHRLVIAALLKIFRFSQWMPSFLRLATAQEQI